MQRNAIRRAFGRGPSGVPPTFWLPLTDSGAGAVSLALAAGTGSATFTRATSATCWSSTGLLLTVGSGVARSTYTELTGANYLGYWPEEARTNSCIQNRDFTNAAWTATNCTTAKDQVGIDGVANAASSLLATAGNATVSQSITITAVSRPFSVYVKRLIGTGNIQLAQDGATFTTQTVANDGRFHRCTLVASQLNPTLTIRIVTNGDKIAVDYAMLEDTGGAAPGNATAGSPIATTTVAVTRNADVITIPAAGNIVGTVGTAYCEGTVIAAQSGAGNQQFIGITGGSSALYSKLSTHELSLFDGTAERTGNVITLSSVPQKFASMWSGSACKTYIAGVASSSLAFDGDLNVGANLFIGCSSASISQVNAGAMKNLKIWNTALTDGQIAAL